MEKDLVKALLLTNKIKYDKEFYQKKPYTFCKVMVKVINKKGIKANIEGFGFSKFNPKDKYDLIWSWSANIGKTIAYFRALDMVTEKLIKMGITFSKKWHELDN